MERYGISRTKRRKKPPLPPAVLFTAMVNGTLSLIITLFFFDLLPALLFNFTEALIVLLLLIPAGTGTAATWYIFRRDRRAPGWSAAFSGVLLSFFTLGLIVSHSDLFELFTDMRMFFIPLGIVLQVISTIVLYLTRKTSLRPDDAVMPCPGEERKSPASFPRMPGELVRDRYRIVEGIGQGASGSVYLVQDTQYSCTDVRWVLKEVNIHGLAVEERQEAEELFKRECALLQSLNHPAIPKVIEYFFLEGVPYLVMEHVAGESLESMIKKAGKPVDIEKAFTIADELTGILSYLHSLSPQPLIFRDLKPSNIMMTDRGRLRLIDFGIARYFEPGKARDTFVYGTPGFSPPEQYGTGQTDRRSDIYSLGATLFYLLTLEDPEQFYFNFPPLRNYNSQVSREFQQTVLRCLARKPDERFEDAEALAESLKKARQRDLHDTGDEGKDLWIGYYFIAAFLVRFLSIQGDRYNSMGDTYAFAIIAFVIVAGWIAQGIYRRHAGKHHGTARGNLGAGIRNLFAARWARMASMESGKRIERGIRA